MQEIREGKIEKPKNRSSIRNEELNRKKNEGTGTYERRKVGRMFNKTV